VAALPNDHENLNDTIILEELWRPDIDLWRTAAFAVGGKVWCVSRLRLQGATGGK
jgi:hypothetical protein